MQIKIPRTSRALALGCALVIAASCSSDPSTSPTSIAASGAAPITLSSGSAASPAGSSDSSAGSSPESSTDSPTDSSTDSSTGSSTAPPRYVGPLDQILGYGGQPDPGDQAAADAQQLQVEDATAACMQVLGFQYVPFIPDWDSTAFDAQSTMDPGEFARQYGYGISTIDYPTKPNNTDPNEATVTAMTPAERSAYYKALYGAATTVDDEGNPVRTKPAVDAAPAATSDFGCVAQASTDVYGSKEEVPESDNQFASLETSIGALYDSIERDQRVVDATTAWIGCMADAGHPGYTEKTDAPVDVGDKASTLRGDADDFSEVDQTALQELRAYEISVATADYTCGLAFDDVHHTVETELETTFIDQNRAELEQYRDALAAGTAGHG